MTKITKTIIIIIVGINVLSTVLFLATNYLKNNVCPAGEVMVTDRWENTRCGVESFSGNDAEEPIANKVVAESLNSDVLVDNTKVSDALVPIDVPQEKPEEQKGQEQDSSSVISQDSRITIVKSPNGSHDLIIEASPDTNSTSYKLYSYVSPYKGQTNDLVYVTNFNYDKVHDVRWVSDSLLAADLYRNNQRVTVLRSFSTIRPWQLEELKK